MEEIVKHINDTNASYRTLGAGDAKNTDLFLDNDHYELFKDSGEQITVRFNKENLTKAILFIASILPRKYDNSAIHKTIFFSTSFVYDQLAFLDGFFTVDGVKVESKTQIWNARKDIMKANGEIDKRFYFNGLFEDVEYINIKGEKKTAKFTIRNYFAGGYSDLHIKKAGNGIFDVWITNVLEPYNDGKEKGLEIQDTKSEGPLQQIFYGAPGTGKSHEIKRVTSGEEVIRTTFHPDSDYSTFVGAYKPTTQEETVMTVIGTKAVPVENADGSIRKENKIVYEFVNQAFLQAYINAWKLFADDEQNPKKQYLVIEEINRGNCAQIFGDLFQLLDRSDSGFSEYPIKTDADMEKHLSKAFKTMSYLECPSIAGISGEDVARKIRNGEIMLLPPNLYIWATMNTSDQSLFPIDSAFKRRWDWKYMPIEDANLEWIIKVNGNDYKWFEFLQAINKEVLDLTHSEDKQLGYFFAKAQNGIIDANTLVNKVYFYLWNDVFKDYDIEGQKAFRKANSNDTIAFKDFFDGLNVIESVAEQVLINLGLNKPEEPQNENIN